MSRSRLLGLLLALITLLAYALNALGMACAEIGHFDDAQEAVARAIKTAHEAGREQDTSAMQQRLLLYQKHQPWRGSFSSTPTRSTGLPDH